MTVFPSGKKMFAYVSSTCGLQEESELSVEGFCLFQYFTVCRNDTIVGQLKAFNVFFLLKCLFPNLENTF